MQRKYIVYITSGVLTALTIGLGTYGWSVRHRIKADHSTTTVSVQFVNSTLSVGGTVTAQNQAKLNFQTSGKLLRLPFKEGDRVRTGQTVAQLDTYALQRQLASTLNAYRSTRDSFDQTQANAQSGVLVGAQKYTLQVTNKGGFDVNDVMGDIVKRILDQNQATLDNSVIQVELANYALQLSRLTSPLDGIVTHQDVAVAGVNITPATSFVVADPASMVFRANVPASSIYYVTQGSEVTVAIDGVDQKIQGSVSKIYPAKVALPNGQAVYQVDIVSDALKQIGKLDQSGTALITTHSDHVALIPAWTVLGGTSVWVNVGGSPTLKQVKVGKVHGDLIEVLDGLSPNDQVIIDPQLITSKKYTLL